MKKWIMWGWMLFLIFNCAGRESGPGEATAKEDQPLVTVSLLPQRFFVEKIAGDLVRVIVMVPPGYSPATYAPTPRQLQELSRSRLYFRIGHIPFEKAWLGKIADSNPGLGIVDTSRGVELIAGHDHENERNQHTGIDPHIWLSPQAVKVQVEHIWRALAKEFPRYEEIYKKNFDQFISEIDELDRHIRRLLSTRQGNTFMVFHPAWGYFAREYGLVQLAIEVEGKSPNPADMKRIVEEAVRKNIRLIFIQKQFDTHSAQAVAAEIGARLVPLDPLAEDWLDNMRQMARAFARGMR